MPPDGMDDAQKREIIPARTLSGVLVVGPVQIGPDRGGG